MFCFHRTIEHADGARPVRNLETDHGFLALFASADPTPKRLACQWAGMTGPDGEACQCIICLDTSPPPTGIKSGCACRGDSGLAHIACLVQAAASQQAQRGSEVWLATA
jgi:hypothetical protein